MSHSLRLILALIGSLAMFQALGSSSEVLRVPLNYSTIQDAVDAACPGDTVLVESGMYPENLVIDKSLTVVGNKTDGSMPVVDAGGWVSAIVLQADGITIDSLAATNSSLGSGIEVRSSCNVIANCSVYDNTLSGIKFKGDSSGNIMIWNSIHDNGFSGIEFKGSCVESFLAANRIEGNGFEGMTFGSTADNNQILVNVVDGNAFAGIQFRGRSIGNEIVGNHLKDNAFGGLELNGPASGNWIIGNRIIKNNFTGLFLSNETTGNLMSMNFLALNTKYDAYDSGIGNCWDNGSVGNYHSANVCEDKDRNGICDDPFYVQGGSGKDSFPLIGFLPPFALPGMPEVEELAAQIPN